MKNGWMVRAGEGGRLFEDFESNSYAAIGWNFLGKLDRFSSVEEIREMYINQLGNAKPSRTNNAIAMIWKFKEGISKGDILISYSPERRVYLVGEDLGEYYYEPTDPEDKNYSHRRKVKWYGPVPVTP